MSISHITLDLQSYNICNQLVCTNTIVFYSGGRLSAELSNTGGGLSNGKWVSG